MIDREHDLPITRQAKLLNISRGSVYYLPRPVSDADLALMATMDRLHPDYPFMGSRALRDILLRTGFPGVGRRRIATLMKKMGIEAIYRKPNTSKRHPNHKIYPYLLRGLSINRPNHVWALDITYLGSMPFRVEANIFTEPLQARVGLLAGGRAWTSAGRQWR